ncbi:MAG TPA: HNH endonuclease [Bellilinea sp.]|nr:HNH endonuclease [Bellilinea sp.]
MPALCRRPHYSNQSRYRKYRDEIRQDCQFRCVYCDIHETEAGGAESMTLDHFRPKKMYPKLEHEPTNLMWACAPCNQLKGNDWPAYGLPGNPTINGKAGYVNPFNSDRNDYFKINGDGSLEPLKTPAEYMIYNLALNRSFLRYVRRRRDLIYSTLLALKKHFESELETLEIVLADASLSELEKMRWIQDRARLQAFLEVVIALDEALSLT